MSPNTLQLAAELKELMLRQPRWTLAAAESLTSGNVQALIGAVPGASEFFRGGVTTYSLEQKAKHLGVDPSLAAPVNCVATDVAQQMARGVAKMFGSTWGVATTGYAEAWPEKGVETPFAWMSVFGVVDGKEVSFSTRFECPGKSRVEVQIRVAEEALRRLVEELKKARSD